MTAKKCTATFEYIFEPGCITNPGLPLRRTLVLFLP